MSSGDQFNLTLQLSTAMDRGTLASFACGAAAGAAALWLWQRAQRHPAALHPPDTGLHHEGSVWHPQPHAIPSHASVASFHEDDILGEQLTRNVQFFGLEAQQRIGQAFVVVVGLGVSAVGRAGGGHVCVKRVCGLRAHEKQGYAMCTSECNARTS